MSNTKIPSVHPVTPLSPNTRGLVEQLLLQIYRGKLACVQARDTTTHMLNKYDNNQTASQSICAALQALNIFTKAIRELIPTQATATEIQNQATQIGEALSHSGPLSIPLANVTRRVLWIVREAAANPYAMSLSNVFPPSPLIESESVHYTHTRMSSTEVRFGTPASTEVKSPIDVSLPSLTPGTPQEEGTLRGVVLAGIEDLYDDIDSMISVLCRNGCNYIGAGETVLTLGASQTTIEFFRYVGNERSFKLVILDTAGTDHPASHQKGRITARYMARALARCKHSVHVEILPLSNVLAVMSRIDKAIVHVHAVLGDSSVLAPVGTFILCQGAKELKKPVFALATEIKMSPYYPSDQRGTALVKLSRYDSQLVQWRRFSHPSQILPLDCVSQAPRSEEDPIVINPKVEHVPHTFINSFITSVAKFYSVHTYLREQYHTEDQHF